MIITLELFLRSLRFSANYNRTETDKVATRNKNIKIFQEGSIFNFEYF